MYVHVLDCRSIHFTLGVSYICQYHSHIKLCIIILYSTDFHMALTGLVLIFMTTAIVLQSISGAPLISKNDTNLIKDEGAGKNVTQKFSLLEDGLFEGDIEVTEEFIRQHYNFSSIPGGEKYMTHENENDVTTEGGEIMNKRAAVKSNHRLWTNGIVPYQFSSTIQTNYRHCKQIIGTPFEMLWMLFTKSVHPLYAESWTTCLQLE